MCVYVSYVCVYVFECVYQWCVEWSYMSHLLRHYFFQSPPAKNNIEKPTTSHMDVCVATYVAVACQMCLYTALACPLDWVARSSGLGLKFSDTEALQFALAEFKLVLMQLFSEAGARSPTGRVVPQRRGVRRRDCTKSFLSHLWSEEQ